MALSVVWSLFGSITCWSLPRRAWAPPRLFGSIGTLPCRPALWSRAQARDMGEVLTGRRTVDGTRDAARPGLCAGERGTRLFGLIAGPDGPTNRARLHGRRSRQLSRMDKCQRRSGLTAAQAASVLHLTGPKVTKPFDANIDELPLTNPNQRSGWSERGRSAKSSTTRRRETQRGPTTCGWSPMFGCWPMTTSAASRDFETLSVPRPSGRVQSSQLLYEDGRYTSVWDRWWYPVRHAISQLPSPQAAPR